MMKGVFYADLLHTCFSDVPHHIHHFKEQEIYHFKEDYQKKKNKGDNKNG